MLTIKTNHQFRNMIYGYELTENERAEFDYLDWTNLDTEAMDFVRYRGRIYDVGEFIRCDNNPDLVEWHGYMSDTYFSGVLIKLSEDGEQAKMATYFS